VFQGGAPIRSGGRIEETHAAGVGVFKLELNGAGVVRRLCDEPCRYGKRQAA
jgi:hypothetical protein